MDTEWSVGLVETGGGNEVPSIREWRPAQGPGRCDRFDDVSKPVAYRTKVGDPRSDPSERAFIELEGLRGRTEIWINEENIGEHSTDFLPGSFEFTPTAENEILILSDVSDGAPELSTPHRSIDPTAIDGQWDVRLTAKPKQHIRDIGIRTVSNAETGTVEVDIEVDILEPIDDAITVSIRPEGFRGGGTMERVRVSSDEAGRHVVSKRIEVRDPRHWWPRIQGDQHRYTLRAKFGEDSMERTFGLRSVELDGETLLVNDESVSLFGFSRHSCGDPDGDVDVAKSANASIIRVSGHVPSHRFFRRCDEEGIVVWQDLPFDIDTVDQTVLDEFLAEYGHHPSLGILSASDERVYPFSKPTGSGLTGKLGFRWRSWRANNIQSPEDGYERLGSSEFAFIPSVGQPGTGALASYISVGWRYLDVSDIDWLLDRYPHLAVIVGGFGSASVVDDEQGLPADDDAILSARGIDIDDSPGHQARTLKGIAESLRIHGSSIAIADSLRDDDGGGGFGVVTKTGEKKPAFARIADAFEPLQAVFAGQPVPGSNTIVLLNDTPNGQTVNVTWEMDTTAESRQVEIDANSRERVTSIDIPASTDEVRLIVDGNNERISNRYLIW